jgi:hypothetical protein
MIFGLATPALHSQPAFKRSHNAIVAQTHRAIDRMRKTFEESAGTQVAPAKR